MAEIPLVGYGLHIQTLWSAGWMWGLSLCVGGLRRYGLDPPHCTEGVVGQLALPGFLARCPAKPLGFQFGPDSFIRLSVKDDLEPVHLGIDHDPTTVKLPALLCRFSGPLLQLLYAGLIPPNVGVVVGKLKGGVADAATVVRLPKLLDFLRGIAQFFQLGIALRLPCQCCGFWRAALEYS